MSASSGSSRGKWLAILGAAGLVAAMSLPRTLLLRLFIQATEALDHRVGWHRLPRPIGLIMLIGMRKQLRRENLYDTSTPGRTPAPPAAAPHPRFLTARSPDGTYNDLDDPTMGSVGQRFGRNVPLQYARPEPEPDILTPSPRTVSRELLTREQFIPAPTLNVLAAAWLQFMIRDWFSHGKSPKDNPWQIPLEPGDPWHENPMIIMRTPPDPTRTAADEGLPPTHINTESPWWDASQIYGTDENVQRMARSGPDGQLLPDGKLLIGPDRLLPIDPVALSDQLAAAGRADKFNVAGWWLGLAMLETIFILEHNAICDRLRAEYPSWSGDDIFDHARLINAALLAKIHTVEWTTGILGHPTMQIGMRANWWGIAGERLHKMLGRISESEVLSGIPGSPTDHYGVPYSLTEEFVAVYRMHPLLPDDFTFRSAQTDEVLQELKFPEIAGRHAAGALKQFSMTDLLYSFGVANPGAVVLHNFPSSLQRFERPDGVVIDLAATDIMRSRELGVPRYNQFRRLMHLRPVQSFEELTDNPVWREQIRRVYNNDIERVDLTVGMFAETPPRGFGFSDTAFRIFVLMASRRLNSDRFFTTDYTPEVYTPTGLDWIDDNTMATVLLRHYPQLAPALRGVKNAFAPWAKVGV